MGDLIEEKVVAHLSTILKKVIGLFWFPNGIEAAPQLLGIGKIHVLCSEPPKHTTAQTSLVAFSSALVDIAKASGLY